MKFPLPLSPLLLTMAAFVPCPAARAETVLLEAEGFAVPGGWILDTQAIDSMGSPYLLAHGLGQPVKNAETSAQFSTTGIFKVWVRTKDWVAPWKAEGAPGKFQVSFNGQTLEHVFGTTGAEWHWEPGGEVIVANSGEIRVELKDLTGFDGRCDALIFSSDPDFTPPATQAERRVLAGLPERIPQTKEYDLVVCGGGYAGMGAALSAARQGLKVALLQNRPVLGGNGSSEVRVWAQGGTRRGLYPRLGEIVEEFADKATNSPGQADEFGDAAKEKLVRSEKNIDLFLNHHVWAVEMIEGNPPILNEEEYFRTPDVYGRGRPKLIDSVTALDVLTGLEHRFRGKFFVDATGHGTVGDLAGAKFSMLEKGHLGMSNMWFWQDAAQPKPWKATPWALPLAMGDFPITVASQKTAEDGKFHKGEWFWESGFDKHPIRDLETMRDWNLRAVFGAFSAMKLGPQAEKYAKADLQWVASVGGTRESRLLEGDVILSSEDIVSGKPYPDGCVPTTWDLDLHYPKEQYAKKFPDNPFISRAHFGQGVDRKNGYPIPYRCFYSKNIDNLFMAGRNISVTHGALGTTRVMRTCGMMGEVVGKAAYLCLTQNTSPRGVYQSHLDLLKKLFQEPGAARRETLTAPLIVPPDAVKLLPPGMKYLDPATLPGIVIDDSTAKLTGKWTEGTNLPDYVGKHYLYATADSDAEARFEFAVPESGNYEVRVAWQPHPNRSTHTRCEVAGAIHELNQREAGKAEHGFTSLGVFPFKAGQSESLTLRAKGSDGFVHADAIQLLRVAE
ncbi:MAG: FAD-dependent oxidoreductase [Verrucomicrobiota bacterium]